MKKSKVEILKNKEGMYGVYATQACIAGEIVYGLSKENKTNIRTRTSIQIENNTHVEDEVGKCINHHCSPTCEIEEYNVVARKDINIGDEITFDYTKNETVISSPFVCMCCNVIIA